MSLTYSKSIPFGEKAKDFFLPCVDSKTYSLADFKDKKALVIVFMCNHCPYVQARWDRLIALQKDFGPRDVQLIGINSNDAEDYPEDGFEKMKDYAREKGQNFPYLCDESQEVAKKYGAMCTPDIFVYNAKRELAYHGRIDNLKDALEAILAGEKPSKDQLPSMGCSIKWKV